VQQELQDVKEKLDFLVQPEYQVQMDRLEQVASVEPLVPVA